MNKLKEKFYRRSLFWFFIFIILAGTVATVYGVLSEISLNSPTSFPVDI